MAKNVYRTAMGQLIDMDNLRLMNERQPAVGNMNVNARGDEIAPDGSIVNPRNKKMKEHYTQPTVKYNPNKRYKDPKPDPIVKDSEITAESAITFEDEVEKFEPTIQKPVVQQQIKPIVKNIKEK